MTKPRDTEVEKQRALLATKLHFPSLHQRLISRPRLVEQLDRAVDCKLTLVSAPAGYGKTTLISQWLARAGDGVERLQDRAAWVSLEDDLDLHKFWAYLFRVLETLASEPGDEAPAGFDFAYPAIETALPAFVNSVSAVPDQLLLVLDDYDTVEDQAVHEALAALLETLPANLHLIISSRIDPPIPLARLRLTGDMLELRAADLAFTPDEAVQFLNQALGLSLSVEEATALAKRTEGWIAGLHAAALSLQGRPDPAAFIQALAGSQRYVMDFLVEEVLQRQPEAIQSFLLATAILDRLCGPLCDAVTGRTDGQETLAWLEKANLFIVPLDDQRQWYRYHRLFSDVLRQRLWQSQPEKIEAYRRLAREWHERNNTRHEDKAHNATSQALIRAEPGGHARTFVNERQSLAAFTPVDGQTKLPSTEDTVMIEPLSNREREVLVLMAMGASNQEIAGSLSIALTTAKKHVSNILRKLGAANRTEVVARGRDLGLLS